MKRSGGGGSGGGSSSDDAPAHPGLLTLPPELRLVDYLDGGGIGGTHDLYSLVCAHRALAHHAALVTRLDNVTTDRLRALLRAFERDRDRRGHSSATAAAPPPTRAPTALKHLAFARDVAWTRYDLWLCRAFARQLQDTDDGGLAALERLDMSYASVDVDGHGLNLVLRSLAHHGARSRLRALHLPSLKYEGFPGQLGTAYAEMAAHLCRLPQLVEIHRADYAFFPHAVEFELVLQAAVLDPEWSSRLSTLDFAGSHPAGSHSTSSIGDACLQRYCPHLESGTFANLKVLRLEAATQPELRKERLTAFGVRHLGDAWARGVFGRRLEEFTYPAYVSQPIYPEEVADGLVPALVGAWQRAPPEALASLQVLRLHDWFTGFHEAVALMDFFGAAAASGDGRLERLRVLDLTDCLVGDIGAEQLAAAIEGGFGKALEELDLSVNWRGEEDASVLYAMVAEGLQMLCAALHRNGHARLRKLRLNGQLIGDAGVSQIVAAWLDGDGIWDALEELSLRDCDLTDDSLEEMIETGFLGHAFPTLGADSAGVAAAASPPASVPPPPPPPLQRLVLSQNGLQGEGRLPELRGRCCEVPLPTTLRRLDLARNDGLPPDGLRTIIDLLGAGLRELKVGCPRGNAGPAADADAMLLRVVLAATEEGSPVLQDLRRLDARKLEVSRAAVGELMEGVAAGRWLRKCVQLELACAEAAAAGEQGQAAARLREELIACRRPLVWDVLTINRKGL